MAAVIVNHRVVDFDKWLQVFEQHAPMRQAAGMRNATVWQAAGDPNNVFIYMESDDADKMRSFGESPDLKQAMQQGGVISAPQFTLLNGGRKYLY